MDARYQHRLKSNSDCLQAGRETHTVISCVLVEVEDLQYKPLPSLDGVSRY